MEKDPNVIRQLRIKIAPRGIGSAFEELANDSGRQHALDELQHWQVSLECMAECGAPDERNAALVLLRGVNTAISRLLERIDPNA
jgi:hypothetical protein